MLHTLETIFGTAIAERPYSFPKGTIGLIRHGYSVSELIWDDRRCLLVTPREEAPSLKIRTWGITEALASGMDQASVMRIAGHASPQTMKHYVRVASLNKDIQDGFNKVFD